MQAEIGNDSDNIFEGICKGAVKIHGTKVFHLNKFKGKIFI
jgi:hypothetical protein